MVENTPRVLAGRYEVGELIGRGGMAEVHIGHDARLGRTVAIKVLRSDLARDPSFLARFRREAQSAAALNHPAIVSVYDTGEDVHTDPATGTQVHVPFIVMEYVEGHTVRDILHDGAAVPIEEAVEITVGVLSALEYSHHAGIVHRDIKPANVMITPTGAVKVMDFGIARAVADSAATMTATHAVIGTAQYLSPEQARGEQVDARSDLYSTGCLLFELLTGRPPFVGDSPVAVAYQHVGQAPQRPSEIASDVPEVLDRITIKALAKERGTRYSSAAEFRADLESAMRGGAVVAPTIAAGLAAASAGGAPTVVYGAPGYGDAGTQVMTPGAATATQPWGATGLPQSVQPGGPGGPEGPTREEREEARRKKALMWWLIGIGVVAIATIITLIIINANNKEPDADLVKVPEITAAMTKEEAGDLIRAEGLEFVDQLRASDQPKDTFLEQTPVAGEMVERGSTVTAFYSTGPETFGVPDVVDQPEAEARAALEAAGLVVGEVTTEPSVDIKKGNVTRTNPAAGQAIQSGQTVDLFVSDGTAELIDLTGMTRDEVEAALADTSFRLSFETVESETVDPGRVVDQNPAPGFVAQNERITIRLAEAPPEVTITVPDLKGKDPYDDETLAAIQGLRFSFPNEPSDDVPPGRITRTDPPANTQLKEGDPIAIYISSGPGGGTPGDETSPPPDGEG